jgi:hypothetical protein
MRTKEVISRIDWKDLGIFGAASAILTLAFLSTGALWSGPVARVIVCWFITLAAWGITFRAAWRRK